MLFDFHEGITGIVGPNGSGKSNVSDAVRWVLGEQSARQLRGGNMQDVIFAGTETRKPQSFAAVSITFDNSDHALDIDFEEVTVTRRLYRSGESEYKINNSTVRLRDIHELFYDTGIGKEGYSIIGQGQIERIISGKPDERRELFDEAAGIVKFKRRKNATLKKLDEEQANLLRVNDILTEISGRLGPLKKQSEVAKVYLEKRDTLRELDVNLFLIDNERIGKELQEIEGKVKIADDQIAEIVDDVRERREIKYKSAVVARDSISNLTPNTYIEHEPTKEKNVYDGWTTIEVLDDSDAWAEYTYRTQRQMSAKLRRTLGYEFNQEDLDFDVEAIKPKTYDYHKAQGRIR